jgi:hypothetical protein
MRDMFRRWAGVLEDCMYTNEDSEPVFRKQSLAIDQRFG